MPTVSSDGGHRGAVDGALLPLPAGPEALQGVPAGLEAIQVLPRLQHEGLDWATRTVLSWRLSNTLDSDFCTEALEEALAKYKRPKIFNTDQGSQFTSQEFTEVLKRAGVRISMDGKGRWMDNIFIERLWRSLKYECVYLHDFEDGPQARQTIGTWIRYYNEERPHSTHADDRTPMEEYARRRAA